MSPTIQIPRFAKHIEGRKVWYVLLEELKYYSPRFDKTLTVPAGYVSDGASGPATDLASIAWWVHDLLCDTLKWDDETPCNSWDSSLVLSDILKSEGRSARAWTWRWFTYIWQKYIRRKP